MKAVAICVIVLAVLSATGFSKQPVNLDGDQITEITLGPNTSIETLREIIQPSNNEPSKSVSILIFLMVLPILVGGYFLQKWLAKSSTKEKSSWRIPIVREIFAMTNEEGEMVRKCADEVISGRIQLHEAELTWLNMQMVMVRLRSDSGDKDTERCNQLKAIIDKMQKEKEGEE